MKKNYSAPKMEQVRMESEMPVMAGSGAPTTKSSVAAMAVGATGTW
ncbi:MAG: hypothetical protein MJ010_07850 [Paludibacteraceae bacterium]|nr:hypothetical protein [Paludibacteraceae bacterium]